jgi:hypothetical protein
MQTLLPQEQEKGIAVFSYEKPTYEQAKALIKGQVRTMKEYTAFVHNHSFYQLPANPRQYYKKAFVSNYDFFGTYPTTAKQLAIKKHWDKVHSGEVTRKPYTKKVKSDAPTVKVESTKIVEQPVEDDRITLINIMRKYDILDLCKDGLKTLFTYEELYEMVIK